MKKEEIKILRFTPDNFISARELVFQDSYVRKLILVYHGAKSVSGHMNLPNDEYSKTSMLSEDGRELREERTVYSHTAWIEENSANKPFTVQVKLTQGDSLLTFLYDFCKECGINAAGIRFHTKGNSDIAVRGRVLKHIPQARFVELQEATDIAIEKDFLIPKTSELFMYGTIYNRYEPHWKVFTGGM